MEALTIEILENDVVKAAAERTNRHLEPFNPLTQCPTAQALRRIFPWADDVSVGVYRARVDGIAFHTSDELMKEINSWCATNVFQPGCYTLQPIEEN